MRFFFHVFFKSQESVRQKRTRCQLKDDGVEILLFIIMYMVICIHTNNLVAISSLISMSCDIDYKDIGCKFKVGGLG